MTKVFFHLAPLTKEFPVHRERSSLTDDIAGTRSQMTLMETRIGTDNNAPGTPQSHVQKINETNMTTGLRVNRRPSNTGVMRLDSSKCNSRYQAGGRTACHKLSNVRRPTVAIRVIPTTGPK